MSFVEEDARGRTFGFATGRVIVAEEVRPRRVIVTENGHKNE